MLLRLSYFLSHKHLLMFSSFFCQLSAPQSLLCFHSICSVFYKPCVTYWFKYFSFSQTRAIGVSWFHLLASVPPVLYNINVFSDIHVCQLLWSCKIQGIIFRCCFYFAWVGTLILGILRASILGQSFEDFFAIEVNMNMYFLKKVQIIMRSKKKCFAINLNSILFS